MKTVTKAPSDGLGFESHDKITVLCDHCKQPGKSCLQVHAGAGEKRREMDLCLECLAGLTQKLLDRFPVGMAQAILALGEWAGSGSVKTVSHL